MDQAIGEVKYRKIRLVIEMDADIAEELVDIREDEKGRIIPVVNQHIHVTQIGCYPKHENIQSSEVIEIMKYSTKSYIRSMKQTGEFIFYSTEEHLINEMLEENFVEPLTEGNAINK